MSKKKSQSKIANIRIETAKEIDEKLNIYDKTKVKSERIDKIINSALDK